jgi:hypothetical protein
MLYIPEIIEKNEECLAIFLDKMVLKDFALVF